MNALIINLKSRPDRRIHIENEIKKLEPILESWEIMDAIVAPVCFKSHQQCVRTAKERGWNEVLVIEDDLALVEGAIEIIKKGLKELPEYQMLYFGANLQSPATWHSEHLVRISGAYAAHCTLIHSSLFDTILNLPDDGTEMDVCYRRIHEKFSCFCLNPMVAYQAANHSDLQGRFRDYTEELNWNFKQWVQ